MLVKVFSTLLVLSILLSTASIFAVTDFKPNHDPGDRPFQPSGGSAGGGFFVCGSYFSSPLGMGYQLFFPGDCSSGDFPMDGVPFEIIHNT